VSDHGQRRHDHGQGQRPPEAVCEVHVFGIRSVVERRHHWLERHAADRTIAGLRLPNLRMHRAGVDRSDRAGCGLDRLGCVGSIRDADEALRFGGELRLAP
jgi:hypothetical protein